MTEPAVKRAVAFVDGQNLFYAVKTCFGYPYPNYNVQALARAVCQQKGWSLIQTRFYTGMHDPAIDAFWHGFWASKLASMGRLGVWIFTRPLRYRQQSVRLPDGTTHSFRTAEEKGVDVRLALDIIRLAHRDEYDIALVFSQDQDLSEVADEIRAIAREQGRWMRIASAFPSLLVGGNRRGINKTDWIPIDQATYDACVDPYDHRPSRRRSRT